MSDVSGAKSGPNVLITHAYSVANKGDAALLGVLIDEVNRVFAPQGIRILTLDNVEADEAFEGVPLERSFMSTVRFKSDNFIVRVAYGFYLMAHTMAWAHIWRRFKKRLPLPREIRKTLDAYLWADVIIPVGGGYLRGLEDAASIYNLLLLIHPLHLGAALDKPTVLFSQSVGPFYWEVERRMVRRALERKIDLILVREEKSLELLRAIGAASHAERSVDAGFLVEPLPGTGLRSHLNGVAPDARIIGVTVRKWLEPTAQEAYERAVAGLADHIIDNDLGVVVFIPQVTAELHADDDRVASTSVASYMHNSAQAHVLMDNFGYREIRALYGDLDLLVGTRFHSVIFALISFVPSLAIEYEHKTSGILRDLGLERWSLPIETVTSAQLIENFHNLLEERTAYAEHLHNTIPAYVAKARSAVERAKEIYDARRSS